MIESKYRKQLNDIIVEYMNEIKLPFQNYKDLSGKTDLILKYAPGLFNAVETAKNTAVNKINDVYENYISRLDEAYTISGSKVNHEDLILLNPDIFPMTQQEFDDIAERNFGNHTMEIALINYAEKMKLACPQHIKSKEQKEEIALKVRENAKGWILNSTENFEVDPFMEHMAGALFNEANCLIE